jgi:hypothetical protein
MGMHWLRHHIGNVEKVGIDIFVVALKVNYLAYAETATLK